MDDTKETEKEPTKINGIGEKHPGFLYTFGTIIIQYDEETWGLENKKHTPIKSVNDFLVSKGYTSKVRSILPGRLIEVIDIDTHKYINTLLLLEELETVPGVVTAQHSVFVESSFSLDFVETIIIQYDEETWEQANKRHTPIKTVNDFLVSKGYTPKVRGILPGRLVEIIDIDKNMDTLPLLRELQTVPGVVSGGVNNLEEHADRLRWTGMPYVKDGPRLITANKVGKIENGRILFELGVLLVTYEETAPLEMESTPIAAVLQSLSDKGYKPIVKDRFHNVQVIDIDENINPLPLFTELLAITGVSNVELNILYEAADRLLGTK